MPTIPGDSTRLSFCESPDELLPSGEAGACGRREAVEPSGGVGGGGGGCGGDCTFGCSTASSKELDDPGRSRTVDAADAESDDAVGEGAAGSGCVWAGGAMDGEGR